MILERQVYRGRTRSLQRVQHNLVHIHTRTRGCSLTRMHAHKHTRTRNFDPIFDNR